ncbi:MAG: flagellar motor switch phosphatase FliY [Bacillaceae bacterium]|nr:flagellar motor switch phosphatase FliY [Bacillaceae bacterium]
MRVDKKDMLSQEEIDALLNQGDDGEDQNASEATEEEETLTPVDEDALGEIGNISFGSAATALSTLLGQKVDITTPRVSIIQTEEMDEEFPVPHVAVEVNYTDGFEGSNVLVIRTIDASIIADLMLGGDGTNTTEDLNEMHLSAVQEAMNQMMGSAATSMSTIFNKKVNITPPDIKIMDLSKGEDAGLHTDEKQLVQISFQLKVGEDGSLIDSNIMQLVPVPFAKKMVADLMGIGDSEEETSAAVEAVAAESAPAESPAGSIQPDMPQTPPQAPPQQEQSQPGMAAASAGGQAHTFGTPTQPTPSAQQANVQPAQFSQFNTDPQPEIGEKNLGLLMDIPLQVTVELGRTKRQIREILELGPGSIVELDKLAGEPVDILVNNKLIAKGEVVVIDENFGVRITDIISQLDRVQKLQ